MDDTLRMRGTILNLCILRMLEGTLSLVAAYLDLNMFNGMHCRFLKHNAIK